MLKLDTNLFMKFVFLFKLVWALRLPGKILLPFYEGDSILDLLVKKLKKERECRYCLATSTIRQNDILEEIFGKW